MRRVAQIRIGRNAIIALLGLLFSASLAIAATNVSYDIVYVRQPRFGDNTNTIWPEVFHPARLDPGADLMLLHPDGSEELLVAGGSGGVTDPFIWVTASRDWNVFAVSRPRTRWRLPF